VESSKTSARALNCSEAARVWTLLSTSDNTHIMGKLSMVNWWNDTETGNWSTGRKTLYSVGGRWMNAYGALVE
jgi:hypothetical protein